MDRLDVRGLSCPQPVFETKKKLDSIEKGNLEILADSGTARDNITRLADSLGWKILVVESDGEYLLKLSK